MKSFYEFYQKMLREQVPAAGQASKHGAGRTGHLPAHTGQGNPSDHGHAQGERR